MIVGVIILIAIFFPVWGPIVFPKPKPPPAPKDLVTVERKELARLQGRDKALGYSIAAMAAAKARNRHDKR